MLNTMLKLGTLCHVCTRLCTIRLRMVPLSLSASFVTRKKTARKISRVKSWGPRSSRGHFFHAVFLSATQDGLSERGTTHNQMHDPNVLFAKSPELMRWR